MSDRPTPPLTTTTSIKPAMSVLIVAVVVLAIFGIIDVTTSQSVNAPPTTVVIVGGLGVDHHSTLMKGCLTDAAPPPDIAPAYLVPVGTTAAGPIDFRGTGPGGYDCERTMTAPSNQSAILGFYVDQLEAQGWSLFSRGVVKGDQQVLLERSGSDTFQWVAGVTINHHSHSATTWTLRFFQNDSLD